MTRSPDYGTWVTVAGGVGLGLIGAWVSDRYSVSENTSRAVIYTVGIFALLAAALRPAWRRLRMWVEYVALLVLHVAVIFPLVYGLDSHSIQLNWAMALPVVLAEFLLFLGLLWRRNVRNAS